MSLFPLKNFTHYDEGAPTTLFASGPHHPRSTPACSGVGCETCNVWYHRECVSITHSHYVALNNSAHVWICFKCQTPNRLCLSHWHDTQSGVLPIKYQNQKAKL